MGYGQPVEIAAKAVAAAGFDACFTGWHEGAPVEAWANTIAREGLIYQSIHSPFQQVDKLWEEGEAGEAVIDMLIACARATGAQGRRAGNGCSPDYRYG